MATADITRVDINELSERADQLMIGAEHDLDADDRPAAVRRLLRASMLLHQAAEHAPDTANGFAPDEPWTLFAFAVCGS